MRKVVSVATISDKRWYLVVIYSLAFPKHKHSISQDWALFKISVAVFVIIIAVHVIFPNIHIVHFGVFFRLGFMAH